MPNTVKKLGAHVFSTPVLTSLGGAQALWWPSTHKTKTVLLFICGNPGVPSYYIPYLSAVHRELRKHVEIIALGHRGHAPLPAGTSPTYGPNEKAAKIAADGVGTALLDQVRHKIAAVEAIRSVYPRPLGGREKGKAASALNGDSHDDDDDVQLLLVGHSVGSYIALEVLKAKPQSVDGIHMLFPTIANIGSTPNARRLRYLLHPLVPTLLIPLPLLILSLLPLIILIPIVRFFTRQAHQSAQSTAEFLITPGAVQNSVRMGIEEMSHILDLQDDTREAVQLLGRRAEKFGRPGVLRTYWAREEIDGWAPSHMREAVEKALHLQPLKLPKALLRSFSPKNRHNRSVSGNIPSDAPQSPLSLSLRGRASSYFSSNTRPNAKSPESNTRRIKPQSSISSLGRTTSSQHQAAQTGSLSRRPSALSGGGGGGTISRGKQRRPSLVGATATRAFDGSIQLELPGGEDAIASDSDEEEEEEGEGGAAQGQGGTGAGAVGTRKAPMAAALSSTICSIGMPHAFCLEHGEDMARITAHWIRQDHLRE